MGDGIPSPGFRQVFARFSPGFRQVFARFSPGPRTGCGGRSIPSCGNPSGEPQFLELVSPDPGSAGSRATLSFSSERSTILSVTPIRIGRGGAGIGTTVTSRESLWQGFGGPFLVVVEDRAAEVREHFRFSDEGSLVAVGGGRAVEVGIESSRQAEAARAVDPVDPGRVAEDWRTFWGETATGKDEPRWVDWILRYRAGRPPIWNEALELDGLGSQEEIGDSR